MSDDDELFRRAMAGVKPLAKEPGRATRRPGKRAARREAAADLAPARPSFALEDGSGRAPGVSRARLAALARGEPPVEVRVDLHGLRGAEARVLLEAELAAALSRGVRCALVIHGRGNHSAAEPVLPGVVVQVLTAGESAASVLGFCRAGPRDGGDGATLVLLRPRMPPPIARFELPLRVEADDIDELGHVSNLVYLRWVQEVAVAHSEAVGFDAAAYTERGEVFVVRRHEIDYLRPAHDGQLVRLSTWVESWNRASCVRRTDIASDDGQVMFARGATTWALIAVASGRPVRMREDLRRQFGG